MELLKPRPKSKELQLFLKLSKVLTWCMNTMDGIWLSTCYRTTKKSKHLVIYLFELKLKFAQNEKSNKTTWVFFLHKHSF